MVDDDVHIVTKDEASEIRARREFTAGLNEARRQFTKIVDARDAEIARLRAELVEVRANNHAFNRNSRRDAEEIARLKEALTVSMAALRAIVDYWNAGNFSRDRTLWDNATAAISKATAALGKGE